MIFQLALFASFIFSVTCRIHSLEIKDDPRFAFSIESFGFYAGGKVSLRVHDVSVSPSGPENAPLMGFVLYPTNTDASISQQIDKLIVDKQCALFADNEDIFILNISDPNSWDNKPLEETIPFDGLWDLLFTHCSPLGQTSSFHLEVTFINPNNNYLSAGEEILPTLFGLLCVCFFACFGVWSWYCSKHKADVHKIHHLMTLLVFLKGFSLFSEALMYYTMSITGHNSGWSVLFYISTLLRGVLMIVVIALIGAGWSLLKPFLNDREKKILYIALPAQILTSIAIIVVDEMAPGSIAYSAWVDVLHIADLIAAGVVLLPIIWSIKQLRDAHVADTADEKTKNTLVRLVQFRSFYIMCIAYIYFTRILVYILSTTLTYDMQWAAPFLEEVATLVFYVTVGYRFRPAADNSDYLQVPTEEMGLEGADVAERDAAVAAAAEAGNETESQNDKRGDDSSSKSGASSGTTTRNFMPTQTIVAPSVAASKKPTIGDDEPKSSDDVDPADDFGLSKDELQVNYTAKVSAAAATMKSVNKHKQ
jgi:G protein-coupled receptor 107